eukprot:5965135-Pyramimonas_sp.AAC.1
MQSQWNNVRIHDAWVSLELPPAEQNDCAPVNTEPTAQTLLSVGALCVQRLYPSRSQWPRQPGSEHP